MDKTEGYPDIYEQVHYGLQKQAPSYQSEFPHDLPFDPGATSTLFELNYFPSTSSRLLLLIPLLMLIMVVFFRKHIRRDIAQLGLLVALSLVFFGPIRLPSFFPFNTTLGAVKAIGMLLALYAGALLLIRKLPGTLSEIPSLFRIGTYVISLLLSVFVMTNPSFFLADFGIMLSGILFFILGYLFFTWDMGKSLVLVWARLLILPSLLVGLIFVSRGIGKDIVSLLFLRYENYVFLHDLSRGRIFSVIDFEYFIPCVAWLLASSGLRKKTHATVQFYLITALSLFAILLVNYRYRFLTYVLGLVSVSLLTKTMAPHIRRASILIVGVLGVSYFVLSFLFFRSTLLDRFLVRNYAEDQVSIDRRFVMYGQAWELFLEKPLLGVGMGNYKDNVQIVYSRFGGRTYEPYFKILQNVYAYPHNWFLTVLAENGIVGLFALFWMLWMFFVMDVRIYRKLTGDLLLVFIILSTISWLFVFANMFTMMHVSLPTVIVFWACRGMIERMYWEIFRSPAQLLRHK